MYVATKFFDQQQTNLLKLNEGYIQKERTIMERPGMGTVWLEREVCLRKQLQAWLPSLRATSPPILFNPHFWNIFILALSHCPLVDLTIYYTCNHYFFNKMLNINGCNALIQIAFSLWADEQVGNLDHIRTSRNAKLSCCVFSWRCCITQNFESAKKTEKC